MDFADRSNGLRRPLQWTSPTAPMDFADRSDGLRRSLRWTSPIAPMDFADRSNGLRRPLQWTSPIAPMDFADRSNGLRRPLRWTSQTSPWISTADGRRMRTICCRIIPQEPPDAYHRYTASAFLTFTPRNTMPGFPFNVIRKTKNIKPSL